MKKASFAAAALTLIAFSILVLARCSGDAQSSTVAENALASTVASIPTRMGPGGFPLIEAADAGAAIREGRAIAIDVRTAQQYEAGRIAGAVHIPFAQVAMRADELPKDKLIVLYCTCPAEESSGGAAQMLASIGVTNTAALRGGLNAWAQAGLPTTAGS